MTISTPHSLTNAAVLAGLLERLESRGPGDAAQYREVATKLAQELAEHPHDAALENLLNVSPATSALYENLHYAQAGLCRASLEASAASELEARSVIDRARRVADPAPPSI